MRLKNIANNACDQFLKLSNFLDNLCVLHLKRPHFYDKIGELIAIGNNLIGLILRLMFYVEALRRLGEIILLLMIANYT